LVRAAEHERVKAEVLAKVSSTMSAKPPALRVTKAVADYYYLHRNLRLDLFNGKLKKAVECVVSVIKPATIKALIESELEMEKFDLKEDFLEFVKAVADYYSLHRNLRLDFINGKPKKAVEHLVSVIKTATLKALIESKLEMDKSELKKDFLEFVGYLKKMSIIHDEHCHVVEHEKTSDSGMKNTAKSSGAGSRSSRHNSGGCAYEDASNKAPNRDRSFPYR
jgi:hypothetical protein